MAPVAVAGADAIENFAVTGRKAVDAVLMQLGENFVHLAFVFLFLRVMAPFAFLAAPVHPLGKKA